MKSKLKICENCEWSCQNDSEINFLKCLLNSEIKGLVEGCDRFREKTGEHVTI